MSTVNVARPLQVSSDPRSLTFDELEAACSEIFRDANIMLAGNMVMQKELAPGAVSDDFPIFGGSPSSEDAEHHVPGQHIQGGTTVQSKVNVAIDDDLIFALRLPWIDAQLAKWSHVAGYARECVRKISEKCDRRAIRVLSLAARTAAVTNVHGGGLQVIRTGTTVYGSGGAYPATSTGADRACSDFSDLALAADNANWPRDENRILMVAPEMIQVLTKSDRITNRDYAGDGNRVDIAKRVVGVVESWHLVPTLHLPATNITTDLSKYNGDWSVAGSGGGVGQPAAIGMYMGGASSPSGPVKGPVGMVKSGGGMRNVVWWDETNNTWLFKSQLLCGFGKVDSWLAAEVNVHT